MPRKAVTIVLLVAMALGAQAQGLGADAVVLRVGNGGEPRTLDPSQATDDVEMRIASALFEGLVINDPMTAKAIPGIAERWTFNADFTQVTFKLRESTWSDGTPITAKTFVDSWLRTLNPRMLTEYAFLIGMIVRGADDYIYEGIGRNRVGIRALDDRTFQVDLAGSMPYAVDMMTHPVFSPLPMHVIARNGNEWSAPGVIVSNGPFILREWKPGESLTVARNPAYWDAGTVALDAIVYLPIEDALEAYRRYDAGSLDWSHGISTDILDEVRKRPDYQVVPQFANYYLVFNVTRKPFDDVRVRKALAMALDRRELVDQVNHWGHIPTYALVPPMAGYTPAQGNAFDVQEARALLAEAGYPSGDGFPVVSFIYNTSPNHKKVCEWIQESWLRILGIETSLIDTEWTSFLRTRSDRHDFFVARAGWIGDYFDPVTFLDMFVTGCGNNDGLYHNPLYDAYLADAALMPDSPARMEALRMAEELLVSRDQAVIPLYYYAEQDLIDTSVWRGWYPNPLGAHHPKFIHKAATD